MSDTSNTLTRRRVLSMIVVIGLASAALGAGTFAYFSDTADSTGNAIEAGTLDLSGTSTAGFQASDAVPGETFDANVSSDYAGSVNAEVDVDFSLSEPGEGNDPAGTNLSKYQFARELNVTTAELKFGGHTENLVDDVSDTNGNGHIDLADLANESVIDAPSGELVEDGEKVSVVLDLEFNKNAGNDAQADAVNVTVSQIAEQEGAD